MKQKIRVLVATNKPILVSNEDVKNEKNWGRTIADILRWYVHPELNQKQGVGSVVIELFEDRPTKVTLNTDIILETKKKIFKKDDVGKKKDVKFDEIKNISWLENSHDPDSAKIFLVLFNPNFWLLKFDFRYNAQKTKNRLRVAEEFFDAAKTTMQLRPRVYLLWAAAELAVDCYLLQLAMFQKTISSGGSKHKARLKSSEQAANNSGLIPTSLPQILRELNEIKDSARYAENLAVEKLSKKKSKEWIDRLQSEFDSLKKRLR